MKARKRNAPQRRARKTLERALSRAGLGSRTQALAWIAAGRVRVNGLCVRDPAMWVDPEQDRLSVDGEPVRAQPRIVLAMHKPTGYVTTRSDPEGRATVYELLPGDTPWVVPVGRLDRDTSGLLLFTNDTDLAERITNPESGIVKVYRCAAAGELSDEQLDSLRRGVRLSDGPARPARVKRLDSTSRRTELEVAIVEGRNREVRRMLEAIGSRVLELQRVAIGPLRLGSLASGAVRPLKHFEMRAF